MKIYNLNVVILLLLNMLNLGILFLAEISCTIFLSYLLKLDFQTFLLMVNAIIFSFILTSPD